MPGCGGEPLDSVLQNEVVLASSGQRNSGGVGGIERSRGTVPRQGSRTAGMSEGRFPDIRRCDGAGDSEVLKALRNAESADGNGRAPAPGGPRLRVAVCPRLRRPGALPLLRLLHLHFVERKGAAHDLGQLVIRDGLDDEHDVQDHVLDLGEEPHEPRAREVPELVHVEVELRVVVRVDDAMLRPRENGLAVVLL